MLTHAYGNRTCIELVYGSRKVLWRRDAWTLRRDAAAREHEFLLCAAEQSQSHKPDRARGAQVHTNYYP